MTPPPHLAETPSLRGYHDELKTAMAARRDLPADLEDTLIASFLERIDLAVEAKVEGELAKSKRAGSARKWVQAGTLVGSLTLAVPLILVAAHEGGFAGVLSVALVCLLTLLVNLLAIFRD